MVDVYPVRQIVNYPGQFIVQQPASSVTISANSSYTVSLTIPWGKTGLAVAPNITYAVSASVGVYMYLYYSYDGVHYDNYTSQTAVLPFSAGATVQQTYIFPSVAPYVNIVLVNKDTTYSAVLNVLNVSIF